MDDLPVPDERNFGHRAIIGCLNRQDYKQALKLIEKKIQKGPQKDPADSAFLKALKTYAQVRSPSIVDKAEVARQLQLLADPDSTVYVVDSEELEIYEDAAALLSKGNDGSELQTFASNIRFNAVKHAFDKKLDNFKDFIADSFEIFVRARNWNKAQLTASYLEKADPRNMDYPFWKMTCLLLYTKSNSSLPERERKLYETLVFRSLSVWAQNTKPSKDGEARVPKSLRTVQEVLLYLKAAALVGEKELKTALLNPDFGYASELVKGDMSILKKTLQLLQQDEDWEQVYQICQDLLTGAHADTEGNVKDPKGGDWAIWTSYIDAILQLKNREFLEGFRTMVDKHLAKGSQVNKTYRRNARLALVRLQALLNLQGSRYTKTVMEFPYDFQDLLSNASAAASNLNLITVYDQVDSGVPDRVCFLLEYLVDFGHYPGVMADIEPYVLQLDERERGVLLKYARVIMVERRAIVILENDEKFSPGDTPGLGALPIKKAEEIHAAVNVLKLETLLANIAVDGPLDAYMDVTAGDNSPDEMIKHWCPYCTKNTDSLSFADQRHLMCESISKTGATEGIKLYDRALNGFALRDWAPLEVLKTDMHPGDSAAIIAAMSLIKLGSTPHDGEVISVNPHDERFLKRNGPKRLIQAAALLEFAHKNSPANPQILLLLIRLYSFIGAGSLAMRAYKRLNLKQIQLETLGYMLFDRLSSLHPQSWADKAATIPGKKDAETFDHLTVLESTHSHYKKFQLEIRKNSMRCFVNGSYDSVFQLQSSIDDLKGSLGSVLSVMERRTIARYREQKQHKIVFTKDSHGYDILPSAIMRSHLHDNLDYKNFPNYQLPNRTPFVHCFSLGPKPSEERMKGELLIDQLNMVLRSPLETRSALTEMIFDLDKDFESVTLPSSDQDHHFTGLETYHLSVAGAIKDCIIHTCLDIPKHMSSDEPHSTLFPREQFFYLGTALDSIMLIVDTVVNEKNEDYIPDFKNTLHVLYKAHQITSLALASDEFFSHPNVPLNVASRSQYKMEIGNRARESQKVLRRKIELVMAAMAKRNYLNKIIDWVEEMPEADSEFVEEIEDDDYTQATLGRCLRTILDHDFIESFAQELVESWDESLRGFDTV